ncbi:MAG: hypothetical protein Q8L88_09540 [Bacteroidota bacterium]|nr:hypothetical protein [Bacteroidota bacterium]
MNNSLDSIFHTFKNNMKSFMLILEDDFRETNELVQELKKYKPFKLDVRHASPTQNALNISVVISYARSFKNSRGFEKTKDLQSLLLTGFNSNERKLHKKIISVRDTEFAHSDFKSIDIQVYENDFVTHSKKTIRQLLDKHEIEILIASIQKIRKNIKTFSKDLDKIAICRLNSRSN